MDKKRIIELYELLAANKATLEERVEFERLLKEEDAELTLKEYWGERWEPITKSEEEKVHIANYESIFDHIIAQPQYRKVRKLLWPRIAAAASILFILSVGGYFLLHKRAVPQDAYYAKNDLTPGGNKAVLVLAGGRQVNITNAKNGTIAMQSGVSISKTASGQLIYQTGQEVADAAPEMNTIKTPNGGKWNLTLADGTRVWLNAASSITYPAKFTGTERRVTITGEAYFEVVHNDAQPFLVVAGNETLKDIGTHFNINAYLDEPNIKTTLLEGSIKVIANNRSALLKPGQQATVGADELIKISNGVNLDAAIAWKNDLFQFGGSDVKEVMRQFARWYDVDISYQGEMPDDIFGGKISRKVKASEVFEALKRYHLNFKIDGKKVIVSKQ